MDTDEEPSSLSLTPETETGHGRGYAICIVVGIDVFIIIAHKDLFYSFLFHAFALKFFDKFFILGADDLSQNWV
jgi:hypothetical protein